MTLTDSFKTALTGLRTNKSRSILTTLGIVIGISSIILMMSIGQGAEGLILGEISGLGAETIVIRPGKEPSGPSDFAELLFSNSLKKRDLESLLKKSNVPLLVEAVPAMIVPGTVSYEGETYRATVFGSDVNFFAKTFNVYPDRGGTFSEDDIRENASVVVIGSKVAEELFGASDPLGEFIKIKDRKFRVVGIFPKKGQVSFFNFDEMVIMPYTTAQVYVLGIDHYHEIITRAERPEDVDRTVHDIELTLRENHNITNPKDDDFYIQTQQGAVDQIKTIIGALTAFLSSVVAIALVVGGIGVMNIMLVSVTERTREIGLRKAIGATERDILLQFLFEAVILTAVGGIVGILLGASLSFIASIILTTVVQLNWHFTFPVFAAVLGFSVSAVVGLVFGIYPAKQAAAKSPIEALRYE
ncbi:MAG: ABC transporter permease [bacterium]|nr:ABC transporter permease [bacterium]